MFGHRIEKRADVNPVLAQETKPRQTIIFRIWVE